MESTDADVVARARGGDTEAFRALVERHGRRLFHLAYRITGDEQDAEDVVQETFMKAHDHLDRFESRADVGTWLHRIATNRALDVVRARKRRRLRIVESDPEGPHPIEARAATDPSPERLAYGVEVRRRVDAALGRLTPNERSAFVLRHYEQMTIDDIGRELNLSQNATKQSIFRAVRKLRQALGPLVAAGRANP